jgi:hypothetical protein
VVIGFSISTGVLFSRIYFPSLKWVSAGVATINPSKPYVMASVTSLKYFIEGYLDFSCASRLELFSTIPAKAPNFISVLM